MITYGEVSQRITSELRADRAFDATTLKNTVYDSMREVARSCVPLSLVSSSNTDKILRWIDDVNFIRVPNTPSGADGEKIDFDDLLFDAIIYISCKRLSRDRKGDYDQLAKKVINDYQWAIYEGETNVVPTTSV